MPRVSRSEKKQSVEKKIADAVARFITSRLSTAACSVSVSFQPASVIATMRSLMSPAEKRLVEVGDSNELLEEFYRRAFDLGKSELEAAVQTILGSQVDHSFLRMDMESGDAVIVIALKAASASSSKCSAPKRRSRCQ